MSRVKRLKFFDMVDAQHVADTTGSVWCINLIGGGTGETQHVGRKIRIKRIQILGFFMPIDGVSTGADCDISMCRLLCVVDRQSNGALPTVGDILTYSTSMSFPDPDQAERFDYLADIKALVGPRVGQTTAQQTFMIDGVYRKIDEDIKCDVKTVYNATDQTISAISTGAIILCTIGNRTPAVGGNAHLTTRVWYYDQ